MCYRCAIEFKKKNTKVKHSCFHSDAERSFTATATHIELEEALRNKYKIVKFYRAWHYTKFSDNLFKEYVRL